MKTLIIITLIMAVLAIVATVAIFISLRALCTDFSHLEKHVSELGQKVAEKDSLSEALTFTVPVVYNANTRTFIFNGNVVATGHITAGE